MRYLIEYLIKPAFTIPVNPTQLVLEHAQHMHSAHTRTLLRAGGGDPVAHRLT